MYKNALAAGLPATSNLFIVYIRVLPTFRLISCASIYHWHGYSFQYLYTAIRFLSLVIYRFCPVLYAACYGPGFQSLQEIQYQILHHIKILLHNARVYPSSNIWNYYCL